MTARTQNGRMARDRDPGDQRVRGAQARNGVRAEATDSGSGEGLGPARTSAVPAQERSLPGKKTGLSTRDGSMDQAIIRRAQRR
jgi:hypothetical protein